MTSDTDQPPGAGILDPIDRNSAVLFSLFMVLTFTGTLSVVSAGREELRTMLVECVVIALGG